LEIEGLVESSVYSTALAVGVIYVVDLQVGHQILYVSELGAAEYSNKCLKVRTIPNHAEKVVRGCLEKGPICE